MVKEAKPFIASMINTAALTLTSFGTVQATLGHYYVGCGLIMFGIFIEWIKYKGMKNKLW